MHEDTIAQKVIFAREKEKNKIMESLQKIKNSNRKKV